MFISTCAASEAGKRTSFPSSNTAIVACDWQNGAPHRGDRRQDRRNRGPSRWSRERMLPSPPACRQTWRHQLSTTFCRALLRVLLCLRSTQWTQYACHQLTRSNIAFGPANLLRVDGRDADPLCRVARKLGRCCPVAARRSAAHGREQGNTMTRSSMRQFDNGLFCTACSVGRYDDTRRRCDARRDGQGRSDERRQEAHLVQQREFPSVPLTSALITFLFHFCDVGQVR